MQKIIDYNYTRVFSVHIILKIEAKSCYNVITFSVPCREKDKFTERLL